MVKRKIIYRISSGNFEVLMVTGKFEHMQKEPA